MSDKTNITLYATAEETKKIELLKNVLQRSTRSDVLRALINAATEKILNADTIGDKNSTADGNKEKNND